MTQSPYGQPPYGQDPYGQSPYGQPPGQYPYGGHGPPAVDPGPRPQTLTAAFWLMIATGLLTFVGFLINIAIEWDATKREMMRAPNSMTSDEAAVAMWVIVVVGLVICGVMVAIWWLLAYLLGKGGQASFVSRIIITVLAVLYGICMGCSVLTLFAEDPGVVSFLVNGVLCLLGLVVVVLIWLPASSAWIRATRQLPGR